MRETHGNMQYPCVVCAPCSVVNYIQFIVSRPYFEPGFYDWFAISGETSWVHSAFGIG